MPRSKNSGKWVELSEREPRFLFFKRKREEVPTIDEMWSDDVTVSFDPDEVEPDRIVRGYENAMEVLDEADESEYLWAEENQDTAPIVSVCSSCDAKVQTNSKERLEDKRTTHHISTGH